MNKDFTFTQGLTLMLKAIFFGTCLFCLIKFFMHPEYFVNKEVSLLFTLEMLVIAFPASIVSWLITWALGFGFSNFSYWLYGELFFFFILTVLFGYFQWFILFPNIWRRWRKKPNKIGHP
jgi:hypothetical protein